MAAIRTIDWSSDVAQVQALLGPDDRSRLEACRVPAQENDAFVLVAEFEGQIVALAVVHTNCRPELGWQVEAGSIAYQQGANAYLEIITVRREWRGRGIGSRLLVAVEREVVLRGKSCLWCHTGEENRRAQRFYERNGWQHVETLQPPWKKAGRLSRVYRKRIGQTGSGQGCPQGVRP
jgi:ribosomal protein S18 acetylase RimI-like enzyme